LFADDLPALGSWLQLRRAMGRGIAVEFRRCWPAMYAEYKRRCAAGSFQLGDVPAWDPGDRVIFNLGTQWTWRTKAVAAADSSPQIAATLLLPGITGLSASQSSSISRLHGPQMPEPGPLGQLTDRKECHQRLFADQTCS
jgi:hypothetical protein